MNDYRSLVVPSLPNKAKRRLALVSTRMPKRSGVATFFAGVVSMAAFVDPRLALANDDLAAQGTALLRERCLRCHGEAFRGNPRLDFSDVQTLYDESVLVAGDPEASAIYQRVRDEEMPEDAPLDDADKDLLRRWIQAGAPVPQRTASRSPGRALRSLEDEISDIRRDLTSLSEVDQTFRRYLTIRPLHNNLGFGDAQLDRARSAIAKLVNSVSRSSEIIVPRAIDPQETLFGIDLRDYEWEVEAWADLESTYPYGIRHRSRLESNPLDDEEQLAKTMGVRHLVLRGDWFVDTLARPRFYHRFLDLPDTVAGLEKRLGVDSAANVQNFRAARAGFAGSGVSIGHRVLERHPSRDGAYWQSFDFAESNPLGNLFRRPFGPAGSSSADRDLADVSFQHDGGEMIFSLPNGLQGYFLSDGKGNRLDRGPITVVRDDKQTGGTAEVVNAVSCMNCHARGLIDFEDTVRNGHVLTGRLALDVEQLYVPADKMKRLVEKDRRRFEQAANLAMGKWGTPVSESDASDEPIGWLVRSYGRDLDLQTAAAEVGTESKRLREMIELNRELQSLGLRPLVQSERIKRSAWSSRDAFVSPLQETSRILQIGTPNN